MMPGFRFRVHVTFLVTVMVSCSPEKLDQSSTLSYDSAGWPSTFGFGRTASLREIDSLDIDVNPMGTGLPPGSGDVARGYEVYSSKCASCHGKEGEGGAYSKLVAAYEPQDSSARSVKAIGNYWPYATTLYDYINRAMPYNSPGSLTPEEVYSVTAFLLYKNGIIDSSIAIDAKNLPLVEMPARQLFIDDDRQGGPEVR